MIEIGEIYGERERYRVLLDGVILKDTFAVKPSNKPEFTIVVGPDEVVRIGKSLFSEVPDNVVSLLLKGALKWGYLHINDIRISTQTGQVEFIYFRRLSLTEWKEPFSFEEYIIKFLELGKNYAGMHISLDREPRVDISIVRASLSSPQYSISDELERCSNTILQLDKEVRASLLSELRKDSMLTYFDFPEEVKMPCEQYLLYFIQFLRDLGVEATAEIQHEVGQVLFAVTPTDKETALDKIRVALEIYMRLPSSPTSDISFDDEIAVQRLEANIFHLKGQLKLAHAELLSNERTLQAQQYIIDSQQRLVNGLVLLESAKTVTPQQKSEDKEEVLRGVLSLTKVKGKGFELDLPEIFRRLKEFFGKK